MIIIILLECFIIIAMSHENRYTIHDSVRSCEFNLSNWNENNSYYMRKIDFSAYRNKTE